MVTTPLPARSPRRHFPITPQSNQLLGMLRYHPSLEFSPATAPSISTSPVPHEPEALAVFQRPKASESEAKTIADQSAKVGFGRARLQSLLSFAQRANKRERERRSVTLSNFLLQVQSERDEVETALDKATSVATANLFASLVHLPNSEDAACGSSNVTDDNLPHDEDHEYVANLDRLAMQQQLPLSYREITATPWSMWSRKKAAAVQGKQTRSGRENARTEENIGEIQRWQQTINFLQEHTQQSASCQSIGTVQLHGGIMKVLKQPHSGDLAFDGAKDMRKELLLNLKALAKTAKEGDRYWAELLLHPLSADSTPPFGQHFQSTCQPQDANPEDMQTRPSDYKSTGIDIDAIRVSLAVSDNRSPAVKAAADVHTSKGCKIIKEMELFVDIVRVSRPGSRQSSPAPSSPLHSDKPLTMTEPKVQSDHTMSTSLNFITGPVKEATMQAGSTADGDEEVVKGVLNKKLNCREEMSETLTSRFVARQEIRSASTAPDRFLGLLELVRKK